MNNRIRIATTDSKLGRELTSLLPDAYCVNIPKETLREQLEAADIFVLDNATLRALAPNRDHSVRATFVVAGAHDGALPDTYVDGTADDLLLLPLRPLDLGRIVRMHELLRALREAEESTSAIPGLVRQLQEDILLAEKIQRRLIRDKFPPIAGLQIKSRYWCGLKSGGDYFDICELPDGVHVAIILTDCSSYSLSTALLGAFMQFSMNFGPADLADPARIVRTLLEKVRDGMKDRDRLSIFYGILNKKTYHLRFADHGPVFALQRTAEGELRWGTRGERPALAKNDAQTSESRELSLEPGDRLLLASDGWVEAIGSAPATELFEHQLREGHELQEVMNELSFRLRQSVQKEQDEAPRAEDDFPMPPQDCSVLVLELGKNVLRLAR